jgi:phosphoserine phosphatase
MTFLVLSPGLMAPGKRGRLNAATLHAADALLPNAQRRMRATPGQPPAKTAAAVWKLTAPLTPRSQSALLSGLAPLQSSAEVDLAILKKPYRWQDFSVLAMDMDSTVITIECIDEIADFCGKKDQVAAITEAAMRGEIKDYAESLRQRVALLKGLPEGVLQEVIRYRLKFTPGVKELVAAANAHGLHTLLVSGGFVQFTDFVSKKIGFVQTRSNQLEIINGKLTGQVLGTIVDADIKAKTVAQACARLGVTAARAITVGDGANDLKMMTASGLSIAHRAKPAVAAQAMQAIKYGGLDNVLDWFES